VIPEPLGYNDAMPLNPSDVEHIAELARLELSPHEKTRFLKQLSSILEYFEKLQTLDTKSIPATSSVLPPHGSLRKDEPGASLSAEETLKNSAQSEKGQFKVPPIFGERDA
jgi:aspartyl-tRNA(Asn)/glutamyl-tRNA(Gln) amidotransferase subunit C